MAFLVKSHRLPFLLFLNCFRANQVGFKQVFDDLTLKHMDALRPGGGGVTSIGG